MNSSRLKRVLAAVGLTAALSTLASPAFAREITITNEDGSTTTIYVPDDMEIRSEQRCNIATGVCHTVVVVREIIPVPVPEPQPRPEPNPKDDCAAQKPDCKPKPEPKKFFSSWSFDGGSGF